MILKSLKNQYAALKQNSISVDVPSEIFANPPPAWEAAWVNLWFKNECIDQCHYRRRRMFAYSIQPLLSLPAFLFKLIICILALLVGNKTSFTLFKWLSPVISVKNFTEGMDPKSIFTNHKVNLMRENFTALNVFKAYWKWLFSPIFLICATYFAFFPHVLLIVVISMLILFLILTLALLLSEASVRSNIFNFFVRLLDKIWAKSIWYSDDTEIQSLLCGDQTKPMAISQLPRRHRSIKLRFQQLKSQVCKPFAQ
jgi:hypothetical protein